MFENHKIILQHNIPLIFGVSLGQIVEEKKNWSLSMRLKKWKINSYSKLYEYGIAHKGLYASKAEE